MMKKLILIDDLYNLILESQGKRKFLFDELTLMVESYMHKSLPALPPATSTTYMGMAIFNISLLYQLTKNSKYKEEAKRWMDTVISYEEWGYSYLVNVDLSASWILFGLSLGYHYLYDVLEPDYRKKVLDKLIKHGSIMYDYRVKTYGKGWSTYYYQNHNWINMTGLATVGYVIKDEYPEASTWVDTSKENFTHVYPNLADDGSNYEGVPYWHYGVLWLLVYADLLHKQEGINYFEKTPFLKNTFDYKMAQTLPDLKQIINFGDAHDYRSGHSIAMYYKLAAEYNNGYAQSLGNRVFHDFYHEEQNISHLKPGITCEIGLAFLWYKPSIEPLDLRTYSNYQYFDDLGLVAYKIGDEDNSKMLSVKCSKPGGNKQFSKALEYYQQGIDLFGLSHHHPDNSHYILTKDGQYYVLDDGYNRNMMMRHHNVLTPKNYGCDIEGVMDVYQQSIRKRLKEDTLDPNTYGGSVLFSKHLDQTLFYLCETGGVFHPDAKIISSQRLIISPELDYVLIYDQIESEIEQGYQWHFHTDVEPTYGINTTDVKLNNCLRVTHVLPRDFKRDYEIQTVKALFTPQEPNDYHQIDMIDSIIESSPKRKEKFLNILSFEDIKIESKQGYVLIHHSNKKDLFIHEQNDVFELEGVFTYIKDYKGINEKKYTYLGDNTSSLKRVKVVEGHEIL